MEHRRRDRVPRGLQKETTDQLLQDIDTLQDALLLHSKIKNEEQRSVKGQIRREIAGPIWQHGGSGKLHTYRSTQDLHNPLGLADEQTQQDGDVKHTKSKRLLSGNRNMAKQNTNPTIAINSGDKRTESKTSHGNDNFKAMSKHAISKSSSKTVKSSTHQHRSGAKSSNIDKSDSNDVSNPNSGLEIGKVMDHERVTAMKEKVLQKAKANVIWRKTDGLHDKGENNMIDVNVKGVSRRQTHSRQKKTPDNVQSIPQSPDTVDNMGKTYVLPQNRLMDFDDTGLNISDVVIRGSDVVDGRIKPRIRYKGTGKTGIKEDCGIGEGNFIRDEDNSEILNCLNNDKQDSEERTLKRSYGHGTSKSANSIDFSDSRMGHEPIENYVTSSGEITRSKIYNKDYDNGIITSGEIKKSSDKYTGKKINSSNDIEAWLYSIGVKHVSKYRQLFTDCNVDMDKLKSMDKTQLQDVGVRSSRTLNMMLTGIEELPQTVKGKRGYGPNSEKLAKSVDTSESIIENSHMSLQRLKNFVAGLEAEKIHTVAKEDDTSVHKVSNINVHKEKNDVNSDVKQNKMKPHSSEAQQKSYKSQRSSKANILKQKPKIEERNSIKIKKNCNNGGHARQKPVASDRNHSGVSKVVVSSKSNSTSALSVGNASHKMESEKEKSKRVPSKGDHQHDRKAAIVDPVQIEQIPKKSTQIGASRDTYIKDIQLQVIGLQKQNPSGDKGTLDMVRELQKQLEKIERKITDQGKSPIKEASDAQISQQMEAFAVEREKDHATSKEHKNLSDFQVTSEVPIDDQQNTAVKSATAVKPSVASKARPGVGSMLMSKRELLNEMRKEKDHHRKQIRHYKDELSRLQYKDPVKVSELDPRDIHINERDVLGEGSFSVVLRGSYQGMEVAIKRLKVPLTAQDKNYFAAEVSLLHELRHPQVVMLLGVMTTERLPLMVLEYMAKGCLYQHLHSPDRLALDHVGFYQIARDIALGMNYLHRHTPSVLHLDLKSKNILLGHTGSAKIADFGFSKLKHEVSYLGAPTESAARGTPAWMAPELLDSGEITSKADVYSFSIIIWEMLTRQIPYQGCSTFQVLERVRKNKRPEMPDICPEELSVFIKSCWDPNPAKRPGFKDILATLDTLSFPSDWRALFSAAGVSEEVLHNKDSARNLISLVTSTLEAHELVMLAEEARQPDLSEEDVSDINADIRELKVQDISEADDKSVNTTDDDDVGRLEAAVRSLLMESSNTSQDSEEQPTIKTLKSKVENIVPPPPMPPPPLAPMLEVKPVHQKGSSKSSNMVPKGSLRTALNNRKPLKKSSLSTKQKTKVRARGLDLAASQLMKQKKQLHSISQPHPNQLRNLSHVSQSRLTSIAEILKKAMNQRREAMMEDGDSLDYTFSNTWTLSEEED